jgi:MarR family 2-MHQ and catechol resistance regulon transcriptional repressor
MHGVNDTEVETAISAYVKLLRAARAVTARVEPRMAAHGLTLTQLGVLEALLHKGPLTHRELGRKVLTSAGNMTDVIDKLEARGLVLRLRCPADRRLVHVALTESGRCLIETVFPLHAADIAAAMAGLDGPALVQLGDLLRALGMAAAHPPPEQALAGPCPTAHLDA